MNSLYIAAAKQQQSGSSWEDGERCCKTKEKTLRDPGSNKKNRKPVKNPAKNTNKGLKFKMFFNGFKKR